MSIYQLLKSQADYLKPWSDLRVNSLELDDDPAIKFNTTPSLDAGATKFLALNGADELVYNTVGGGPVDNIYTTDGVISGNRIVDADLNNLDFIGVADLGIDANTITLAGAPSTVNTNTKLLTRNAGTGVVELRDAGTLSVYDAIVPDDYALPSLAVAAGAQNIFVRSGTYNETAAITISDTTHLDFESICDTIINFTTSGSDGFIFRTTYYNAGTIALTNGSAAVVGSGTTFTSIPDDGTYGILIDGTVYPIASITDDTNLTLTLQYDGNTVSGLSYAALKLVCFSMQNVTITGANSGTTSGLIRIDGVAKADFNNIRLVRPGSSFGSNAYTVYIEGPYAVLNFNQVYHLGARYQMVFSDISGECRVNDCRFSNPSYHGIAYGPASVFQSSHLSVTGCTFTNVGDRAIYCEADAAVEVSNCGFYNISGVGIYTGGSAEQQNLLSNCAFVQCATALTCYFNNPTEVISISNCSFIDNGIVYDGASNGPQWLKFIGCIFRNNTTLIDANDAIFVACEMYDLGTIAAVSKKLRFYSTYFRTNLTVAQDGCSFVGCKITTLLTVNADNCQFRDCSLARVRINGVNTMINGCDFEVANSGGSQGALLGSTCNICMITNNTFLNSGASSIAIDINAAATNLLVSGNVITLNGGTGINNPGVVPLNNGTNISV